MLSTISEINHQTDDQPGDQPRPVDPPQLVHHIAVYHDSEDRHHGHPGRAERTRLAGIDTAQHKDRYAHDDKRQERPDVHHFSDVIDRNHTDDDRRKQTDANDVLLTRAELRMDGC